MSGLEERIERLEAAEELRALLATYASVVDNDKDVNRLRDLFTADAALENPTRYEGRDAILEYYLGVMQALEASRHHVVNSSFEFETPTRVRHRGAFLAYVTRGGVTSLLCGDYDDEVVRGDDGRWRFRVKRNAIRVAHPLATA
jgi:SnoaL-like protein